MPQDKNSSRRRLGHPELSAQSQAKADALPQQVVVIGGGLAGLTAALHLAERGLAPVVFEADPVYLGGRVAGGDPVNVSPSFQFRDEHGVHGIWSPYLNLQAMLTRYAVRPMFVPAQEETWIYKRGNRVYKANVGSAIRHSWVPAPLHYLALFLRPRFVGMLGFRDWLTLPRVWYSLVFALGIDPLAEGQPLEGLWLSDFVRGWPPALRAFFVGLARNGLSARPEEVPSSGFVAFLRFYTLRRRDAWAFSYMPADGGMTLIDPLERILRNTGGSLRLGHVVSHLEQDGGGWRLFWHDPNGEERGQAVAQHVVLATDAPNTRKILLAGSHTAGIATDLYWPRGMPTAVMRLWFDRSPQDPTEAGIFSGEFVLDNFFWLHRLQDRYIEWHRATGGSAIEVHLYGPPELLEEPDAVLLSRAITEVSGAFPELRGHVTDHFIRRNESTHTLFGVGPADRHLGIVTPWPNLFCCGDWVRHASPSLFLERACVTGIEAANAVLRSHQMEPWPLLTPQPPERLAGWIEGLMLRGRRAWRRGGKRQ
jgi:isorenieratene synthase